MLSFFLSLEERGNYLKQIRNKDNQGIKMMIMLTLITLSSLLVFALFKIQAKNVTNTENAQALIESLYQDELQLLLNEDVTQAQIDDVSNTVHSINSWNKGNLLRQMELIQRKYDATEELSRNYSVNRLLNLKEENVRNYPLKEDVTLERIEEGRHYLSPTQDGAFNDYIDFQYDAIEQVLKELNEAETLSSQLAVHIDMSTIEEDIKQYKEIEDILLPNQIHPQAEPMIERYQHNGKQLGESLLANLPVIEERPGLINGIFETDIFSKKLAGSAIDQRPLVALTFDDGPSPFTPAILDVLDKYDIQAVFFQLGQYIELYPEISRKVVEEGHIVGNHSYSHANFDILSDSLIRREIQTTQELILEVTGKEARVYRTPYGNGRRSMMELYPHLTPVYWNVDSEDWVSKDSQTTIEQTLETLEHRSIILMHDSQESTAQALEQLVLELIDRDYVFVTPDKIPEADSYLEEF